MRFVDVNIHVDFGCWWNAYETAVILQRGTAQAFLETVDAKVALCPCANNGISYRKLDKLSEGMIVSEGVYIYATQGKRHGSHFLLIAVDDLFSALLSFQR